MSLSLAALAERYVFESLPPRWDLGALHVPFDDLTNAATTESRLNNAVRRGEPVALIGPGGSGKSSVNAYVLGPLAEGVAPLHIPLATMPADKIDTPDHLADHLLDVVSRVAGAAADRVGAELAPETTITTSTRHFGSTFGQRWMKGRIAREVQRQSQVEKRASLIDKTDALVKILQIVARDDLLPVLVFDDADRWLKAERIHLVESFFNESLRWMLDLPTYIVVAVHPQYFETIPQKELLKYLETRIEIPQLHDIDAIDAILQRRIEVKAGISVPDLSDLLDRDARSAILDVYRDDGSLRSALRACHQALLEAVGDNAPRITSHHIFAAANAG